ncbi:MAG: hydantoinase/oxoprolinase family protein [Polyangiaceae bacterium]|nr:hydantoinase/oxoprolinase family protein [Polyangiaceae bacterium]
MSTTAPALATSRVGSDVGGTFTDLFLWSAGGEVLSAKVPTTPADPSLGVVDGLRALAEARGVALDALVAHTSAIVHGTTVTTNATLTRRGAKTGLVTTEGVRDALEMRRGIREERYDNRQKNVKPLVPRHLRLPVRERVDAHGTELVPLSDDDVRRAATLLRAEGVGAVAVCFLNAFANRSHERAAAELLRAELPGAFVSVSSEVLPTIRFYNRVSTTVLDAYTGPVLRSYLESLTARLAGIGFQGALLIMQSSGGMALPEATLRRPAGTLLSGPAAGPRAALAFTTPHGHASAVVCDMGGTSFDASLVRDGAVELKTEGEIDRLRVALPMLDIVTIGAGGGSLGWIDPGGLLRMGPESAGAMPGPACYGRGGERPTCTDANVALGFLDPAYFAGGRMPLHAERALRAIETHLAGPLGLSVEEAAAGMYRVINANMTHGVREITVKRGVDPRELPLVVAGGAGGLHACAIAGELEMTSVVVPAGASVLCAVGMLLADLQHDFVRSFMAPLATLDPAALAAVVGEMTAEGDELLLDEGIPRGAAVHEVALDLRYLKQYHEVTVPVPAAELAPLDRAAIARRFHAEHDRLYGYELAGEGTGIELINVRVRALGRTEKPALPKRAAGGADPGHAGKGSRRAYVPARGAFAAVPVFDGHALRAGNVVAGPALVERTDTTVLVDEGWRATVDELGSYLVERLAGGAA